MRVIVHEKHDSGLRVFKMWIGELRFLISKSDNNASFWVNFKWEKSGKKVVMRAWCELIAREEKKVVNVKIYKSW